MAVDDAEFFNGNTHDFGNLAGYIAMARAMEAVAADAIFFIEFIRKAIHEGFRRHGLMECCIENSDLRYARHDSFAGVDADDVRRIVKGCIGGAFFQGFHDFIVNYRGAGKGFAAMDNTVTYRVNGIHGFDNAAFGIGQNIENELYSDFMIRNRLLDFLFLAIPFVSQLGIGKTDFFYQPFCHDFFIVHVYQLVFQGRAAAVYNQYDHAIYPLSCLRNYFIWPNTWSMTSLPTGSAGLYK